MKRILFLLILLSAQAGLLKAQNSSGYILFSMQYSESGLSKEEMAMLPEQSEWWFKGGKMKMRMPMGMGMQSDVLVMEDKVFLLMDLMGNKMAMKTDREEMEKQVGKNKKYKLKSKSAETKTIAGYECRKAIMGAEGEKDMMVWYTDKIKGAGSWYYQMDELDGFPLEFSMKTNEIDIRMVAKEVKLETVSDDVFSVPEGYKVMSQSEMMQMMGGSR